MSVRSHLGSEFQAGSADVNGTRLAFQIGGPTDGIPVILWHGFLGTSHEWRKVAPRLAEAGCAVLVPDMRGFGDSDKPLGPDGYDGRSLANDFRSLKETLNFGTGRPITLVAHDMGAPPALIWAADHPEEIATLHYVEEPVLLAEQLAQNIAYTREGTKLGGLWWWFMAFAPDLPQTLIVGNEEAFLRWFYRHYTANAQAIEDDAVNEYLRTFRGEEGVMGALGVYRAAFKTADQTASLTRAKLRVPVIGYGGEGSQGEQVANSLQAVAENVRSVTVPDCGHFVPEEAPDRLVREILGTLAVAQR